MSRRTGLGGLASAAATAAVVAAVMAVPPSASADGGGGQTPSHQSGEQAGSITYEVGPISRVSVGCPGTGDISEASDPGRDYVYQEFEGCDNGNGIGFARSINGGDSYAPPAALPGSRGGWDPSVAVAPDGTVYAAFMNTADHRTYPVVDVSHNFGQSFAVEQSLRPAQANNWGDADYIAVAANGTLYVAWGYGPSTSEVVTKCSKKGSCWATNGDVNVVVQSSSDEAESFTPMVVVSPGYPDAGADEGDIAVAPDGAIDVLYQGYQVVNRKTLALADGHEFFTTSANGGTTWSAPIEVGANAGQMTINEWWDDGSIASDGAGDLYATWDTQGRIGGQPTDIGWVSFSTDGGRQWSAATQATPDQRDVPHIMEVTGAGYGKAYVAWLSSSDPRGYALYLRTLAVSANSGLGGWLSGAVRISRQFGNPTVFPGDTFGIAASSPTTLVLSWGSAVPGSPSIWVSGGSADPGWRNTSVWAAPVSARSG